MDSIPLVLDAASADSVEFDVVIVGAGPAGAAAALELAGRGVRVGLIEKEVPPRHKTCGGGVLFRARRRLPVDIAPVVERECRTTRLVHHGVGLQFTCRREEPIVTMVMRDAFDALLVAGAQRTGTRLLAGTSVLDLIPGPEEVRVSTSAGVVRARFVIAADGVNSTVARKTRRPPLKTVVPALEFEAEFPEKSMARFVDAARFDFGVVLGGYGWVFPKRGHLSIGVGSMRRGGAKLQDSYGRYVDCLALGSPIREERHGYMIPCRLREGAFDVPRVLFTGDSAGLADPITAEGITAGIVSGQLAARAILAAGADEGAARRRYREALEQELLAELRIARRLAWLVYRHPGWFSAVLARYGQGLCELMTRIVTGETTYRAAIRRPAHYLALLGRR